MEESSAKSGGPPSPQDITARIAILRQAETPLGVVSLRRRWSLALEQDVYEILLNGDLVMSSAVHSSEDALADRSLTETLNSDLKILVGGLGLGFTALRVLADHRVRSVTVVELLAPIIDWHVEGDIPWSADLLNDDRLEIVQADFFRLLAQPATPASLYDLVLVDIDDGPDAVWHRSHAEFYTQGGLESAINHLRPDGVLAFWFATRPHEAFLAQIGESLSNPLIESISFHDPCLHRSHEHFLVLGRRNSEPGSTLKHSS